MDDEYICIACQNKISDNDLVYDIEVSVLVRKVVGFVLFNPQLANESLCFCINCCPEHIKNAFIEEV